MGNQLAKCTQSIPVAERMTEKQLLGPDGHPIQSTKSLGTQWPPDLMAYADRFQRVRKPTREQLIGEYAGVAYACVQKNVEAVVRTEVRLYRRVRSSSTKFYRTRAVKGTESKLTCKSLGIRLADNERLEELVSHPALDVLYDPNPDWDWATLLGFTQAYLEVCGAAYWLLGPDSFGRPGQIRMLQSQHVQTETNAQGQLVQYRYGNTTYRPDQVIPFLLPNLINFHDGQSPLATVFESLNIERLYMATEASMLENEGRPDAVFTPAEGMGESEARRWEHWFNSRFRKGGHGGVIVMTENGKLEPLSYSPRDLARLSIHENATLAIARAYGVPFPLLSEAPASQYGVHAVLRLQHWEDAIVPRLRRSQSILNRHFLSRFDDSGDLFLAFDAEPPADREQRLKEPSTLVTAGVMTKNEGRMLYGMEPEPCGETPADIQQSDQPEVTQNTQEIMSTEQDIQTAPEQTLNGAQIASASAIVEQVATGIIPRDSGIGQLRVLLNLTPEQAEMIMGSVGTDQFEPRNPVPTNPPVNNVVTDEAKGCTCCSTPLAVPVIKGHNRQLPEGDELAKVLTEFFRGQLGDVLDKLNIPKANDRLPDKFVPMKSWDLKLYERCRPVLRLTWLDAYKDKATRLGEVGADPDRFDVTNPNLLETIDKAIYQFAESTNETTTLELNTALDKLKEGFAEGLVEGDRLHELTTMVGQVFDRAEKVRAKLISQTESSWAHHRAERQAAKDSGVVKGFEFLLSADACEVCQRVNAENKQIGLDEAFYVDESAPPAYRERIGPIHPGCRCSFIDIIDTEES